MDYLHLHLISCYPCSWRAHTLGYSLQGICSFLVRAGVEFFAKNVNCGHLATETLRLHQTQSTGHGKSNFSKLLLQPRCFPLETVSSASSAIPLPHCGGHTHSGWPDTEFQGFLLQIHSAKCCVLWPVAWGTGDLKVRRHLWLWEELCLCPKQFPGAVCSAVAHFLLWFLLPTPSPLPCLKKPFLVLSHPWFPKTAPRAAISLLLLH